MANRWQQACPGCDLYLELEPVDSGVLPCPSCRMPIEYVLLPAATRHASGAVRSERASEGEASCFQHPHKRATQECAGCGRYLCPLCAVSVAGTCVCPECLRTGKRSGKGPIAERFKGNRFVPADAAMTLSVLGLIILPAAFLTVPAALTLAVLSFFREGSLVNPRRWPAWVAIALSLFEAFFWTYTLLR